MQYITQFADQSVVSALHSYIHYGLHPGSFGYALLLQDRDAAFRAAHPLLLYPCERNQYRGKIFHLPAGPSGVENLLWLVENGIPPIAKGSSETIAQWEKHLGLMDISNERLQIFIKECGMMAMMHKLAGIGPVMRHLCDANNGVE